MIRGFLQQTVSFDAGKPWQVSLLKDDIRETLIV
jgi:hypothetical protein